MHAIRIAFKIKKYKIHAIRIAFKIIFIFKNKNHISKQKIQLKKIKYLKIIKLSLSIINFQN